MSNPAIPAPRSETLPPIVAIFNGNEEALNAVDRLGLRLLHLPAPGVALIMPVPGCQGRLYGEGARLVVG